MAFVVPCLGMEPYSNSLLSACCHGGLRKLKVDLLSRILVASGEGVLLNLLKKDFWVTVGVKQPTKLL